MKVLIIWEKRRFFLIYFTHEREKNFIKQIKKNYYDLRSKKVQNLINNLKKINFKKSTLGGCVFFKKGDNLCLKVEKI